MMHLCALRRLVCITVAIGLLSPAVIAGATLSGRSSAGHRESSMPESTDQTGAPPKQYSPEEQEFLRAKLLELVDAVQDFSESINPEDLQSAALLDQARQQFKAMQSSELNGLRTLLDPSKMNEALPRARAVLADFKPALALYHLKRKKHGALPVSSALPDRAGPDSVCNALIGSGRPSIDATLAADAVQLVALGVKFVAKRGCMQLAVAIALGEGGGLNTSLACVASDALYVVAKGVRATLQSCNDDFTKRTADADYARLSTISSDITNAVTNDNTNTTSITSSISTRRSDLQTTSNTNKDAIIAALASNTSTITTTVGNNNTAILNNQNTNETNIANAIGSSTTSIDNLAKTNTTNITTTISTDTTTTVTDVDATAKVKRAIMIESLLYQDPTARAGASVDLQPMLYLPASEGGLIEEIRDLVTARLASQVKLNIGTQLSQPQQLIATANQLLAQGHYVSAFTNYRLAYNLLLPKT
jgi:hypothetical protein